ncbi:MAG: hypothetical protein ACI4ON_06045 [Clostridia bacterium]
MKLNLDRIIFYLFYAFLIEFIICTVVIILLTYGIRINRKYEYNKEKFEIVQYEQVYHVFMPQEIFLEIENKSDRMIGTITIKEKKSGKTETLHKLRPGKSTKMYFSLNSFLAV